MRPEPDSFFFEVSDDRFHRLPDTIVVEAARRTMELDEAFWTELCNRFPNSARYIITEGRPRYIDDTSWTLVEPERMWLPGDLEPEHHTPEWPGVRWTKPSTSFADKYPEFYENVKTRPILMRDSLYRKMRKLLNEHYRPIFREVRSIESAG